MIGCLVQPVDEQVAEETLRTECSTSFFEARTDEDIEYSDRAIFITTTDPELFDGSVSGWLEVESESGIEIESMLLLRVDDDELFLDAEGVFDSYESSMTDDHLFTFNGGHFWCKNGIFVGSMQSPPPLVRDILMIGEVRVAEAGEDWEYFGSTNVRSQVMDLWVLDGVYDSLNTISEHKTELPLLATGTFNRAW